MHSATRCVRPDHRKFSASPLDPLCSQLMPLCEQHCAGCTAVLNRAEVLKTRDTAVGAASRVQVGRIKDHVSIPGKRKRVFAPRNHYRQNWEPLGNKFNLRRDFFSRGKVVGTCSLQLFSFSVGVVNVWSYTSVPLYRLIYVDTLNLYLLCKIITFR
jgi:hypothetical protein